MRYIWELYTLKIRTYNIKLHRDTSNLTKEKTWLLLYQKRLFVFSFSHTTIPTKVLSLPQANKKTIIDS